MPNLRSAIHYLPSALLLAAGALMLAVGVPAGVGMSVLISGLAAMAYLAEDPAARPQNARNARRRARKARRRERRRARRRAMA